MRGRRPGRGDARGAAVGIDPEAARRSLRDHLAEVVAKRERLTAKPERNSGISFGKRVGDGTIEAVSRLTDVSVADSLDASIAQMQRALAKLDDGTYGRCDVCGEEIPEGRLEARPESTTCVQHADSARPAAGR